MNEGEGEESREGIREEKGEGRSEKSDLMTYAWEKKSSAPLKSPALKSSLPFALSSWAMVLNVSQWKIWGTVADLFSKVGPPYRVRSDSGYSYCCSSSYGLL